MTPLPKGTQTNYAVMIVLTEFKKRPLLFQDPVSLISTVDPFSVEACFQEMERALQRGYFLAGFLSYEAGYSFENCLLQNKKYDFPLVCMGVYKAPVNTLPEIFSPGPAASLKNLRLNILQDQYFADIETIRNYIAEGDVYQITYCIKLLFDFFGDSYQLYRRLLQEQPVPYPAYIEADNFTILSLSPEKFMKKKSGHIVTKPMKGTWARGNNVISDCLARLRLGGDEKNRACNWQSQNQRCRTTRSFLDAST